MQAQGPRPNLGIVGLNLETRGPIGHQGPLGKPRVPWAPIWAPLGAYLGPRAVNPVRNSIKIAPSVYDVPVGYLEARGVLTNTVPTCPIRGAGEPEGQYTPERLMDAAADELGIDRVELRVRNLISRDQLPYKTITQLTYDCGDFAANLDRALVLSDRAGYAERKEASLRARLLRGFAVCNTIEALGFGLDEEADLRCAPDGQVELRIGSMSNGQGHDTIYAQVVAGKLGIPVDAVRVIQGDTDDIFYGTGTGACRSIIVGGSAVAVTTDIVIEKGLQAAAMLLEASVEDVIFREGIYEVAGTDRRVDFEQVAARAGGIVLGAVFCLKISPIPMERIAAKWRWTPKLARLRSTDT